VPACACSRSIVNSCLWAVGGGNLSEPTRHESPYGVVYLGGVPDSLDAKLADFYESTYSLPTYFRIFLPDRPHCAWESLDPPHIVEFDIEGSAVVVLNGLFPIDCASLHALCRAVFEVLPNVDRIRLSNLVCNPTDLGLPFRVDRMTDDTVVRLPSTQEDYLQTLGSSTRRNMRRYARRFEKEHPSCRFDVYERGEITSSLVAAVIHLNRVGWRTRGIASGIDAAYEARLQRLLQECGVVGSLTVGNALVAGWLGTRVGGSCFMHVTGYDRDYDHLHPGLVCCFFTLNACIDRGIRAVHFLWGNSAYKRLLGGTAQDVYFVTVFRRAISRYRHPWEEATFRRKRARARLAPYIGLTDRGARKIGRRFRALMESWFHRLARTVCS
jgi:CelD/BcsL family acetyltransferase involved in cellulose biosynthesis